MRASKIVTRLSFVAAAFLVASSLLAAVPEPSYSFTYDGKEVKGSESHEIDARLKVTVERVDYPEFDATEWVLWFENPSAEKSGILSDIFDGDFRVALPARGKIFPGNASVPGDRAVISTLGCFSNRDYLTNNRLSAREFAPFAHYFHPWNHQSVTRANVNARSSDGEAPFFEVSQNGAGALVALGWTGDWRAIFDNEDAAVRVRAGLANARFYLMPGEKLRTSRVLVMNFTKGEDASNKFRRLIRRHFSHVASYPLAREGIHAFECWGGLTSDEMIRRLGVLKAKGFSFDDFWIDAGWYGQSKKCDEGYTGDWGSWTGDWRENLRVHPDRFEKVRDAAKTIGANILLWFEPERVVKSTRLYREHPEWFLKGHEKFSFSALLDYGNPASRQHIVDTIDSFAKRLKLSCYRQDFNMGIRERFEAADEKDRRGISEIRHVLGMYQVWDELCARNPGLLIDNCSSGGRRIDLETLRRSVLFFRSDFQCSFNAEPEVFQCHQANLSRLLPYHGCTTKRSDLYSLRSAYSSSFGAMYWNAVFQKETDVDWAAAKKCNEEYLRIRKYFPCDFYNHGAMDFDPAAWAIWQYHDPETKSGIVMAFRRAESPCDRARISLKGIPAGVKIETENLDSRVTSESAGELEIVLPERRSSTIILYREKTSGAAAFQENPVPALGQNARNRTAFDPTKKGPRVLFIGNSITLHGPRPEIGWTNNWGMAASAREKDYVHLLERKIRAARPDAQCCLLQVADTFERSFYKRDWSRAPFDWAKEFKPDVIVLFFGANVPGAYDSGTMKPARSFASALEELLFYLSPDGKAQVLISQGFYVREKLDAEKEIVARKPRRTFVKIEDIRSRADTHGRYNHPNDLGMQLIAERFWEHMNHFISQ